MAQRRLQAHGVLGVSPAIAHHSPGVIVAGGAEGERCHPGARSSARARQVGAGAPRPSERCPERASCHSLYAMRLGHVRRREASHLQFSSLSAQIAHSQPALVRAAKR